MDFDKCRIVVISISVWSALRALFQILARVKKLNIYGDILASQKKWCTVWGRVQIEQDHTFTMYVVLVFNQLKLRRYEVKVRRYEVK